MFDVFIGDQLAAIAAEGIVKIIVNALIEKLPNEFSITVRRHVEQPIQPKPEPTPVEDSKEGK